MPDKRTFDDLYEELVVRSSANYRASLGPPARPGAEAFEEILLRLKNFREISPAMTFWMIVDLKTLSVRQSDGDLETFGQKLNTFKDFFRQIHPDYRLPYLRWRSAAYNLVYQQSIPLDPLRASYRHSLPLQVYASDFYWFTSDVTLLVVDEKNQLVKNLHTFYRGSPWSPRDLQPYHAMLKIKDLSDQDAQQRLVTELSLQFIDEFTNAELDLLSLYAAGKSGEAVQTAKAWSRHTLHEYNANLLKKARALFVYDFRSARAFAEYCFEKGFIRVR